MYVILVYDFGEKRVGKMLKLCRKYLNWIQNSVFEGEISEVKLKELTIKAKAIMDTEEDSIIIFSNHTGYYMNKQVVGKETDEIGQFLVATLYRMGIRGPQIMDEKERIIVIEKCRCLFFICFGRVSKTRICSLTCCNNLNIK
jgi:CRISPR-associated protein Cas2